MVNSRNEEFSIENVVQQLQQTLIDPATIKEEIDSLVIECFNSGEIKALEKSFKDAQSIYHYSKNVEQFLNKWKGNDV